VSVFQFITLAVVFSKGAPYRKAIYTNYSFLVSLIAMTIFSIYLVIWPHSWLVERFEFDLDGVTYEFRYLMVFLAVINFGLAFFAEAFIVDYIIFVKVKEWVKTKTSSETLYDKIFNETHSTNWLPNSSSFSSYAEVNDNASNNLNAFNHKIEFVNFAEESGDVRPSVSCNVSPSKTSPPESGICVSSPASAPLSPALSSMSGNQDSLYRSASTIPCLEHDETNEQPKSFTNSYKSCNGNDFYLASSNL